MTDNDTDSETFDEFDPARDQAERVAALQSARQVLHSSQLFGQSVGSQFNVDDLLRVAHWILTGEDSDLNES